MMFLKVVAKKFPNVTAPAPNVSAADGNAMARIRTVIGSRHRLDSNIKYDENASCDLNHPCYMIECMILI